MLTQIRESFNLHQLCTRARGWLQWSPYTRVWVKFCFLPLYPYLKTMCTLQNYIFFPCCGAVRHAHVGRKISDVNDAEFPIWRVCHATSQNLPHFLPGKCDGGCYALSHVHTTRYRLHKINCGTTRNGPYFL
jgi:hypothetical protein